jgi:hypothetical protein
MQEGTNVVGKFADLILVLYKVFVSFLLVVTTVVHAKLFLRVYAQVASQNLL